ncbi:hypothetical protein DFH09DRAFT_1315081 [Mycena vulgaris]|nr:hypothetical protein DFH09DRAFT_1315081 [Mycena vulgaris]
MPLFLPDEDDPLATWEDEFQASAHLTWEDEIYFPVRRQSPPGGTPDVAMTSAESGSDVRLNADAAPAPLDVAMTSAESGSDVGLNADAAPGSPDVAMPSAPSFEDDKVDYEDDQASLAVGSDDEFHIFEGSDDEGEELDGTLLVADNEEDDDDDNGPDDAEGSGSKEVDEDDVDDDLDAHRRADRALDQQWEDDAVGIADAVTRRHHARAEKETELEDEEISDDERAWEIFKKDDVLHLPGAHDPEVWRIKTYKSARSILNLFLPKSGSADQMKVHVGFTAVVFRPEVDVSTIFIETTNVLALAAKLQNVVIKKRTLVPLEEHPDILKLLPPDPIPPHQSGFWVRIGAGTYRGDLGWCIDDTWGRRKNRHVWVVPRMRGTGPDESNAKGRPEQHLVLTPGPGHRGRVLKCGLLDVGGCWDKLHMRFRDVNPSENEPEYHTYPVSALRQHVLDEPWPLMVGARVAIWKPWAELMMSGAWKGRTYGVFRASNGDGTIQMSMEGEKTVTHRECDIFPVVGLGDRMEIWRGLEKGCTRLVVAMRGFDLYEVYNPTPLIATGKGRTYSVRGRDMAVFAGGLLGSPADLRPTVPGPPVPDFIPATGAVEQLKRDVEKRVEAQKERDAMFEKRLKAAMRTKNPFEHRWKGHVLADNMYKGRWGTIVGYEREQTAVVPDEWKILTGKAKAFEGYKMHVRIDQSVTMAKVRIEHLEDSTTGLRLVKSWFADSGVEQEPPPPMREATPLPDTDELWLGLPEALEPAEQLKVDQEGRDRSGEWLCHPDLVRKRLDFVVDGKTQTNDHLAASVGQRHGWRGYVVLERPINFSNRNAAASGFKAKVGFPHKNVKIWAGNARPEGSGYIGAAPERTRIESAATSMKTGTWRVVIIGEDCSGDLDSIGAFTRIMPDAEHEFGSDAVKVEFAGRIMDEDPTYGFFPICSLCRSDNIDTPELMDIGGGKSWFPSYRRNICVPAICGADLGLLSDIGLHYPSVRYINEEWLSQATEILGSTLASDSLVLDELFLSCGATLSIRLHYTTKIPSLDDQWNMPYLFAFTPSMIFDVDGRCFIDVLRADQRFFWSFDPSGAEPLEDNLSAQMSLPQVFFDVELRGNSWTAAQYDLLGKFHRKKGHTC